MGINQKPVESDSTNGDVSATVRKFLVGYAVS